MIISETEGKGKNINQFVENINDFFKEGFNIETSRVVTRRDEDPNKVTVSCSFDMKRKEEDKYIECPMEFEQVGRLFGIKLGKRQSLFYSINHSVWKVVEFNNPIRTKVCKTPTPKEELEIGKWYFCTDFDNMPNMEYIHCYYLYLGEGKYVYTSGDYIATLNCNFKNCYEVVKDEY